MAKYRKKPVVIDALQFGSDARFCEEFPRWLEAAFNDRTVVRCDDVLVIRTLEGEMTANGGDWIIRGPSRGRFIPASLTFSHAHMIRPRKKSCSQFQASSRF